MAHNSGYVDPTNDHGIAMLDVSGDCSGGSQVLDHTDLLGNVESFGIYPKSKGSYKLRDGCSIMMSCVGRQIKCLLLLTQSEPKRKGMKI